MRRYRSKLANHRQQIRDQYTVEKSRRTLAEIRRRGIERAHGHDTDVQGLGDVTGSDADTQVGMELEHASTNEHSSNEDSEYETIDTQEHPLTLNDTDKLIENLRLWANRYSPSHSCISDLLKILRMWFVKLPAHSRTLLGTKTNFKLQKVAGGDYIHISVQHALPLALKHSSALAEQLLHSPLKLQLNFDGVPMFGSTNYSIWPILAKVVSPVETKVFAVGVFGGKKSQIHSMIIFILWLMSFVASLPMEASSWKSLTVVYL